MSCGFGNGYGDQGYGGQDTAVEWAALALTLR